MQVSKYEICRLVLGSVVYTNRKNKGLDGFTKYAGECKLANMRYADWVWVQIVQFFYAGIVMLMMMI